MRSDISVAEQLDRDECAAIRDYRSRVYQSVAAQLLKAYDARDWSRIAKIGAALQLAALADVRHERTQ